MRILFFILPILLLSYVLWHVWVLLPCRPWLRIIVVAVGLLSFLMLFAGMGLLDRLPLDLASWVYGIGTTSILVYLYLAIIFILLDVGTLVRLVPPSWVRANGVTAIVLTVVLTGIFSYGYVHYHHKYRQSLSLDSHGKVSRPVRIVMISDVHLGYHNRRADLRRWVDQINAEHPDLILVAGDLIDNSLRPLLEEHDAEELRRLSAPVYACLGNHEYFSGQQGAVRFYREAGIHLLRDSVVTVGDLCLIGRDDRMNRSRRPLRQLAEEADRSRYIILIDHQPYHLEEAEQCGIDFQLSGHTHYGQVWPISWITDAIYEDAVGPLTKGRTQYYVSSGLGIWGGKYRIGTRSEYVVATLR